MTTNYKLFHFYSVKILQQNYNSFLFIFKKIESSRNHESFRGSLSNVISEKNALLKFSPVILEVFSFLVPCWGAPTALLWEKRSCQFVPTGSTFIYSYWNRPFHFRFKMENADARKNMKPKFRPF